MNKAATAAFSFEKYSIIDFSFKSLDDDKSITLSFDPEGIFDKADSSFLLKFNFDALYPIEGELTGSVAKATMIALFKFNESIEFGEIPDYFYGNAIAIAAPYLRAFISTLTLLANVKQLVLPIMNLSHLKDPLKENTVSIDSSISED